MSTDEAQQPETVAAQAIEVIGDATPEQVAALVAVLSAASGGAVEAAPARQPSAWSAPAGLLRRSITPGPGGWQHSLRP